MAQNREPKSIAHERVTIDDRFDNTTDSEAEAFLEPYRSYIDSIAAPVVGQCARDLDAVRPESEMSNLLSDILVWSAVKDYNEQVDFALYNIGGIRASFPKGTVTMGDIVDVAPFENKIAFMTLKGCDVTELFEQIAVRGGEGVSSAIRAEISDDGKLLSLKINGKPVDQNANYRITTIDYLIEGNDGMTALRKGTTIRTPNEAKDNTRIIIMNYFKALASEGKAVDAKVEGRIVLKKQDDGLQHLVILHSNDTHSQIMPFSTRITDKSRAGRAGFLRRLSFVNAERKTNPELLLFDSGDFSQGSTYYTMFKGDVEVGLMSRMHYDAATIGNHEFDFGLENMARLFRSASFPVVCANYDFKKTVCRDCVKDYIVIERQGLKIGVFGLSPKLEGLVSKKNYGETRFLDPIATAEKMVKTLREKEKCDLVICLSHLGYKVDEGEIGDDILAERVSGIDLILGGHTHTFLENPAEINAPDGRKVLIDQNGKAGIYLSKFTLSYPANK